MPTNYTAKRRLGSIRTNASSQITAFTQVGDEFLWKVAVSEVMWFRVSLSARRCNLHGVPPGVKSRARLRVLVGQSGSAINSAVVISSLDEDVTFAPPAHAWTGAAISSTTGGAFTADVRSSAGDPAQVNIIANNSSGTTVNVATYGWIDDRGQNA